MKPFRILGLQQIAIGGLDKQRLRSLWVDVLGLEVKGRFVSERENVDEDICALGRGVHAVEVDLMQPLDAQKKPAVQATPLNHVGLWVDDLRAAYRFLEAQGVRFTPGGIRPGAAGHRAVAQPPTAARRHGSPVPQTRTVGARRQAHPEQLASRPAARLRQPASALEGSGVRRTADR